MKKLSSNGLVKILVPAVVAAAVFVGVKAFAPRNTAETAAAHKPGAIPDLSPEDLKTLGVEGDTTQDTLRTVVGNFRKVTERLDGLESENTQLRKENGELHKASTNVEQQVNQAVSAARSEEEQQRNQLSAQVHDLSSQVSSLMSQLKNGGAGNGSTPPSSGGVGSDIPLGLGYDNGTESQAHAPGADGMVWVEPRDGIATDANGRPVDGSGTTATGFTFASSFDSAAAALKDSPSPSAVAQNVSAGVQASGPVDPVFTLPENSTLVGSRAMTALLGRVPIDGKVTDPYPFKVMIGKDNLTANGIELPDVQGAIISGTATGDWTLSCVRGSLTSITFVFTDGTVRTLPSPDGQQQGGSQGNQGNQNGSIGWLSDDNGIPCISGDRKSNASTYLPTIDLLAAASAAGDAFAENQNTSQTNALGGVTSTLTGDAGKVVMGKALSGGMRETVDWVKARYGQTFDAIYVPPGQKVAVHITRQLAIDYAEKGRKVKYDFSLAGNGTGMD
ncbi:TIGR03752 family integrating conjugative element protein [Salmonella enterica subsp. enterica serovar Eastbourne]|nr:TIGR03752 family integrating conjugative element protein [Salmonella enterica subsp. enterica serovar Eastbourne]